MRWTAGALIAAFAWADSIPVPDGSAQFDWLSSTTFRIVRRWGGSAKGIQPSTAVFESSYLKVEVDSPSLHVVVSTLEGKRIAELNGPERLPGKIVLERSRTQDERIYGR